MRRVAGSVCTAMSTNKFLSYSFIRLRPVAYFSVDITNCYAIVPFIEIAPVVFFSYILFCALSAINETFFLLSRVSTQIVKNHIDGSGIATGRLPTVTANILSSWSTTFATKKSSTSARLIIRECIGKHCKRVRGRRIVIAAACYSSCYKL